MCTLIIRWHPGDVWPLIIGGNRDEMKTRQSKPPGRHWPDRPEIIAGIDETAGGSWLGVNEFGVVAAILNRSNSLGPKQGKRSRGELVLEALDHADASDAAKAITSINEKAYRSFNMILADNRDAFWLKHTETNNIALHSIPEGISMITADDLNDIKSPRIAKYLKRIRKASIPNPGINDWDAWQKVLADQGEHIDGNPLTSINIKTDYGFGTVSSSLLAVPNSNEREIQWKFCPGTPDTTPFHFVEI
tara:strand:- start:3384 stop:4127 length:744 start_codon:yes stop_codon:yes gene_type:complete